jgi:hypothetical protein
MSWQHYGSFTLAKFVGKNVSDNTRVLALATLGDKTKNRNDPISSFAPPKNNGDCRCHGCYRAKLCQCKHGLLGKAPSVVNIEI